jgi:hypothetical protein
MTAAILISIIGITGILLVGTTGVITMAVTIIQGRDKTSPDQMGSEIHRIIFFITGLRIAMIIIPS